MIFIKRFFFVYLLLFPNVHAVELFTGLSLFSYYGGDVTYDENSSDSVRESLNYFITPFDGSGTKVLGGVKTQKSFFMSLGYTWGKGEQKQSGSRTLDYRVSEFELQVGVWSAFALKPYVAVGQGGIYYEEKDEFNLHIEYSFLGTGIYILPRAFKEKIAFSFDYKANHKNEYSENRFSFNTILLNW